MAEHAQIDIRKGMGVIRIHSGWGVPTNVLPALRQVAAKGYKTSQSVANSFMRQVEDASFGLSIIPEDFQRDALSYHYTVDISKTPWTVVQEKCAHHKLVERGDGTAYVNPKLSAARKRTLFV